MHRSFGFGLIELMVVVAIVAVLAAIALPAYQMYTVRSQVAEGFSLASGARDALVTYYGEHGTFPSDNAAAGMPPPTGYAGTYVERVSVIAGGGIEVRFGGRVHNTLLGKALTLQAQATGGSIRWTCTGLEDRYLPTNCR